MGAIYLNPSAQSLVEVKKSKENEKKYQVNTGFKGKLGNYVRDPLEVVQQTSQDQQRKEVL